MKTFDSNEPLTIKQKLTEYGWKESNILEQRINRMTTEIKYLPKDISNPFTPSKELLPPYDDIPDDFKISFSSNKWLRFFNDMFFKGIRITKLVVKTGIDKDKAFRHIRIAAQGWDSKHEHKEAGIAYLMSLWFDDIEWETSK